MIEKFLPNFRCSSTFKGLLQRATKSQKESIIAHIIQIKKQLEGMRPGLQRALYVLQQIEAKRSLTEQHKKQISCKAGCAHCCHVRVDITNEEADLIIQYIAGHEIDIDQDLLQAQKDLSYTDYWKLPKDKARCIFLDVHNTCKIYDVRPIPCRNLVVTSDPAKCAEPQSDSKQEIKALCDYVPEVIASSYQQIKNIKLNSLPKMISERIIF